MALFANDDEDDYGQPREKSFLSKVGSFLWNGLKVLAIIALAIVALVSFSDTARDKLNEWTKDKDGNGGWGDKIRETLGLEKEDLSKKLSDGAKKLWNGAKEALGIAHNPEDKGEGVAAAAMGTTAVVGAGGAYAANKIRTSRNNELGEVKDGKFVPAPKDEIKAAQELAKNQERLKTLKEAAEKAEQDAAKIKADAEKIKASRDSKRLVNPSRLKDAWDLRAEKEAPKLEKKAEELRKSITVLEKSIADSTARPLEEYVTRADAAARSRAMNAGTKIPTTATEFGEITPTPASKLPPSTTVSPTPAATAHTATAIQDAAPHVPKAPTPPAQGGMWSAIKKFFERHPIISKAVTPLSAAVIVTEGTSHAVDSWNSGKKEEAATTALKTTAEAGMVVVASEATMIGSILNIATPDSVKNALAGPIKAGEQAFLQRKLDNLPTDKKAIIADWHKQAEELGLKNISDAKIMAKLEEHGWGAAPKTPSNALVTNKEQVPPPVRN